MKIKPPFSTMGVVKSLFLSQKEEPFLQLVFFLLGETNNLYTYTLLGIEY